MRKFIALMAVALLVTSAAIALARVDSPTPNSATKALMRGELENDMPAPRLQPTMRDTIDFGFYEVRQDGQKWAIRGEKWTWDHGAADPLEGWTSVDLTANLKEYWRWMSAAQWAAEGNPGYPGGGLAWPDMGSGGYALCGSSQGHADSLGWASGLGYGNNWCQRLTSPTLTYDGTGAVDLSFRYFNYTEADYDYSKVFLQTGLVRTLLNPPGFNGEIGISTDQSTITPVTYTRAMQNADFGGGTQARNFTVTLEFVSDGGLSDEDGANGWDALWGAWGVDDITLQNNIVQGNQNYTFDNNLQGWTRSKCPGAGSFMGIAPLSQYIIQDPCECNLAGNVLEMHDANFKHPGDLADVPQHEQAYSNGADRITDIGDPLYLDYNRIIAEWDQYAEMPQENGVFYRPGWSYYPYENPNVPGLIQWSPRVGQNTYFYVGLDPVCYVTNNIGTDWGLPSNAQKVKFIFELNSTCEGFGIPTPPCTNDNNFTPIIDNVRIRNVGVANAPAITFEVGCQFNDAYGASSPGLLSTSDPVYANITYDTRMGNETAPAKQGDSLVIKGPVPAAATKWESKLWLRVKRKGPGQSGNALYNTWRNAFVAAKGINFDTGANPPFTWGYMDSIEVGVQVSKNKFCSQFRDGPSVGGGNLPKDLMFNWGGGGEHEEGNEILPDLALTPGTKVDYFITSNYICLPTTYFYLPDTTGQFYSEIEALPSYRLDGGTPKFPCLLYVDAFNRGSQFYIENALNVVLNGALSGDPIPDPTSWDRYDYLDCSSNWKAPMYREFNGNSGATLTQLLGYRAILFNTGTFDTGCTWTQDWLGMQAWLTTDLCDGNLQTQGFIADGTSIGKIIRALWPSFLTNLGAIQACDSYFEPNCPAGEGVNNDTNYCVRVTPVPGTPFGPGIPTDVFGNWCPPKIPYGVLSTTDTGAGNKYWQNVTTGYQSAYAQIINDKSTAATKYRSVIEDWSYHLLVRRDLDNQGDPGLECPTDSASRVDAAYTEISNSLRWIFGIAPPPAPLNLGLCIAPGCGVDVPTEEGGNAFVNRLWQNSPNPFNPRTVVKFSLAQNGPAQLIIYDVNGRKVRTLVDGPQVAGVHEVVWDGTNDAGKPVASGVFWSQLKIDNWSSNRKMVVLK